ncbi:MAG: hypothetical protein AAGJ18_24850, partial [Bacteroidota bacterium]
MKLRYLLPFLVLFCACRQEIFVDGDEDEPPPSDEQDCRELTFTPFSSIDLQIPMEIDFQGQGAETTVKVCGGVDVLDDLAASSGVINGELRLQTSTNW